MGLNEIDYAIYLILTSDTTFASYFTDVTTQVVYGDDQSFQVKPRVVFEKISSPNRFDKPEKWERWGFNVSDTKFEDCEKIQNRIVYLFNQGVGTKGTVQIQSANVIDRGRSPLWDEQEAAFKTRVDVRITYL